MIRSTAMGGRTVSEKWTSCSRRWRYHGQAPVVTTFTRTSSEMAAAYFFHLVRNHPFLDGNKRVGAVAALVFLEMNGIEVGMKNRELFEAALAIAEGRLQKSGVAEFLRRHADPSAPER